MIYFFNFSVWTVSKIVCFQHISTWAWQCLVPGPNILNVYCAHLYVIIMFLGLAVSDLGLFGSTEEPVACLTKESCLWGQELHTCRNARTEKASGCWSLKAESNNWRLEVSPCKELQSYQRGCVGWTGGGSSCRLEEMLCLLSPSRSARRSLIRPQLSLSFLLETRPLQNLRQLLPQRVSTD